MSRAEVTEFSNKQDAVTEAMEHLVDPDDRLSVTIEPWYDGWRVVAYKESCR